MREAKRSCLAVLKAKRTLVPGEFGSKPDWFVGADLFRATTVIS